MTTTQSPAPAVPSPQTTPSTIQTDTFCDKCGYNLFTQPVTRDERLGILITRCPECGTFHAAGKSTSAGRIWLQRLGTLVLIWWSATLLALWALHLFFMGVINAVYIEMHITYNWNNTYGPGGSYAGGPPEYLLRNFDTPERYTSALIGETILITLTSVLGISLGTIIAVFLWHLAHKWWRFLAILWPVVPLSLVAGSWLLERRINVISYWILERSLMLALLSALGIAIGLMLGRPIIRGVLRILLPTRLLHHLDFLWRIDDKIPPTLNLLSPA